MLEAQEKYWFWLIFKYNITCSPFASFSLARPSFPPQPGLSGVEFWETCFRAKWGSVQVSSSSFPFRAPWSSSCIRPAKWKLIFDGYYHAKNSRVHCDRKLLYYVHIRNCLSLSFRKTDLFRSCRFDFLVLFPLLCRSSILLLLSGFLHLVLGLFLFLCRRLLEQKKSLWVAWALRRPMKETLL